MERFTLWSTPMSGPIVTRPAALAFRVLAFVAAVPSVAGQLEGTATYRERIALPPDAVFEAALQDVSRADAPATVIGRVRVDPAGQPPLRFTIDYDDAAVRLGRRYSVRAAVTHRDRLLYTTDRVYSALDGRGAKLELLLVPVRGTPPTAAPAGGLGALPASFEGNLSDAGNTVRWHVDLFREGHFQLRTASLGRREPNQHDDVGRWMLEPDTGRLVLQGGREAPVYLEPVDGGAALRKLDQQGKLIESAQDDRLERLRRFRPIEPRLFLSGMFVDRGEATNIALCADNRSMPVAEEGDFRAMQDAYRKARSAIGERLLVGVEGKIASRPSKAGGRSPQTVLVVERFVNVFPGQRCPGKRTRS
jgi:uncharacterized lipoprotein YbaY